MQTRKMIKDVKIPDFETKIQHKMLASVAKLSGEVPLDETTS